MSYGIKPGADIAPDAIGIVSQLYRVIPCVVRRWAITQSLNAVDQLTYGIRYVIHQTQFEWKKNEIRLIWRI